MRRNGAECDKYSDHKHMTACAKCYRDCAKACREMIKHMAAKYRTHSQRRFSTPDRRLL